MRRGLAALAPLIAACFGAAVSAPRLGVVVHRHVGGEHLHVHESPGDEPHRHDGPGHHHHHDDDLHHHPDDSDAATLAIGGAGWAWHAHWTQPFHRVAPSARPALADLQLVSRVTATAPLERVAAALIATRSRAPPSVRPT